MVELARRLADAGAPPPVGLELVFSVSEENGLHGAKAFDVGRLRSAFGYVFDHASPIGEIITAAPTYQRVTADLRGRAAHAGLRPEQGRSAIAAAAAAIVAVPLGRLDDGHHGQRRHHRRGNGDQCGAGALHGAGRGPRTLRGAG